MPSTAINDTMQPKLPVFSNNLNSTPKPFKSFSCDNNTSELPSPPPSSELHFPSADLKTPSAFVPYRKLNAQLTPSRNLDESVDTNLPHPDINLPYPHTNLPYQDTSLPHSTQSIPYNKLHPISSPVDRLSALYADKLALADRNLKNLDTVNNNNFKDISNVAANINNKSDHSITGNINNKNANSVPVTSPVETLTPSQIIRKFNATQTPSPSPTREASVKREVIRTPNTFCERSQPLVANANFSSPFHGAHVDAAAGAAGQNVDAKYLKLGNPEQFVALSSYVSNRPQLSNALSAGAASPMLPLARNASPATVAAGASPAAGMLERDRNQNPRVHFGETTLMGGDEELLADPGQQLAPAFGSTVIQPETYGSDYEAGDISCHQCKLTVQPGQVVVVAERAGRERIWHPPCFVCVICQVSCKILILVRRLRRFLWCACVTECKRY